MSVSERPPLIPAGRETVWQMIAIEMLSERHESPSASTVKYGWRRAAVASEKLRAEL
jgi:hypothetical protein